MQGIVIINKPDTLTSNAVVSKVKKIFKQKKVGHLGTLDPLGCGVLPVTLGSATKLFDLYLNKTKKYRTIFKFGCETDTLDSNGVITSIDDKIITEEDIVNILPEFEGKMAQIPPKYSAKSIDGVRAYELARQNKEFELKAKEIEIYRIELIKKVEDNSFMFDITCSSGTYIRSICRDIAYRLGTVAYMSAILRIKAGDFSLENSIILEELEELKEKAVTPIKDALSDMRQIIADETEAFRILNGQTLIVDYPDGDYLIVNNDETIAIAVVANKRLKMKIHLKETNNG